MTKKPHPPDLDELLPAYAMGVLEGPELEEIEALVASGDAEVTARLAEWQETMEALAESVEPIEPSEEARSAILAAVAPTGDDAVPESPPPGPVPVPSATGEGSDATETPVAPPPPRRREPTAVQTVVREPRRPWLGWVAAAAAALAIWAVVSRQSMSRELDLLRGERDQMEVALAQAQESHRKALDAVRSTGGRDVPPPQVPTVAPAVDLLASPDTAPITLAGLQGSPDARGRVFVDSLRGRAQLYVDNLPALPDGKEYQLWAIADGPPVSAGVFQVDLNGSASYEIPSDALIPRISTWAVTIEDAGGVPQPTGTMVLAGQA